MSNVIGTMKIILPFIIWIITVQCVSSEKEDKKINLNYELDKKYHYCYELNISNSDYYYFEDLSNFTYNVNFYLHFKSKTDGYLKIENVTFKINDLKKDIETKDLTEHCLKFSYKNGQIIDLEVNNNEKTWSLNFKRGLLSVFQNSLNNFPDMIEKQDGKEEDVHGLCKTCYMIGKEINETVEVRRIKNLTRCEHQSKEKYVLFSTPIHLPKEYISETFEQDLHNYNIKFPFSGSLQECRYFVKQGIYQKLLCNETYVLQGYDTISYVNQLIKFVKTEDDNTLTSTDALRKTKLFYEYDDVIHSLNCLAEYNNSQRYLNELCQNYYNNDLLDSAVTFSKLVESAKALNTTQLNSLLNITKDYCQSAKKYFYDLVPHIGSENSIVAMLQILQTETLDQESWEEWLSTLAVFEPISKNILNSARDLLKQNGSNYDILLTVSTIASSYCKANENCKEDIQDIIKYYEDKFLDNYSNLENDVHSEEVTSHIVLNLKALSNIGLPKYTIHSVLQKIVEDTEINPMIRVAAIDVYRKRYCENSLPIVEKLYKDTKENIEVRIASYLKVMECAGIEILPHLYKILKEEELNQVTYFIWSHLNSTQIKETEIEHPQVIFVDLLGKSGKREIEQTTNKTVEEHKESENKTETKKDIHALLEDFIFSKNDNKETVEAFKECTFEKAVQVILNNTELCTKYKGDYRKHSHFYKGVPSQYTNYSGYVIYSQSSFIPKSSMLNITYNPFNQPMELLQMYANAEGLDDYFLSLLGSNDFFKRIATLKTSGGRKDSSAYPKLSLGLKLFGNDIKYTIFNGEKSIDELIKEFNPIDQIKERAIKGINCQKSGILTDLSFSVPTAGGFPLNLKLLSSYYARFNVTTFKNETDKGKFTYNGNVKPGKTLSLTTSLGIDGYYASSGILGRLSLNVSYNLNTGLELNGTEYSRLNLSLAENKMDLLRVRIELKSLTEQDKNREGKFFDDEELTGPRCVSYKDKYPIDFCYPENTFKGFFDRLKRGLVEIDLYLQKNNNTIEGSPLFTYERKKIEDSKYSIGFYVQNEEICLKNLTFNTKDKNLQAILESDGEKKLFIDGTYNDDEFDKYISWNVFIDGQPLNYWESSLRKQFTWENTKMNVMFAFYGFQGFARILMT